MPWQRPDTAPDNATLPLYISGSGLPPAVVLPVCRAPITRDAARAQVQQEIILELFTLLGQQVRGDVPFQRIHKI
jgi:hypothetical protein